MGKISTVSTPVGLGVIALATLLFFGPTLTYSYFAVKMVSELQSNQVALSLLQQNTDFQIYKNTEYGFELTMPKSWNGYSIKKQNWQGWAVDGGDKKYSGAEIIVKNPKTTANEAWQDIPIMIFAPDIWTLIVAEKIAVSAAPIGPAKIGENSKYIFATPPRWYGFTDAKGWQEAVEIVKTFKAF